jgi:DNA-binding SARP family transcriptional activator/tetratricopeptide (TPR) repeat protein
MKFRLLGPLELCVDGRITGFASSRQRGILALLLLQRGRIVPLDQIIEALWDSEPPTTAKGQVQTCVSALRRQLRQFGAEGLIRTSTVGYSIHIPDDCLDAAEFERLTACGTALLKVGRTDDAVRELRAGLKLWRGPAVANVESRLIQGIATRLNEERGCALEECIELELSLGLHHKLVGELSELVKRYPLREVLRAQHMLALYRSGRQAEALESLNEIRTTLTDELGIDPGDRLSALHQAILAQDSSLDLSSGVLPNPAPPGNMPVVVIPRQLPAAIADFSGRQKMLSELIEMLSDPGHPDGNGSLPVACLYGEGGVGKTSLAIRAAHAVRHRYPDGQLFVQVQDADGQAWDPADLLARLLHSLGWPPRTIPDQLADRVAAYRSWLGDRRVLIVLDDVPNVANAAALLPGNPDCGVLITSRSPLASLPGARHFQVRNLEENACVELVAKLIGPARTRAELSAVRQLVRLCDCLPLAVRIVAAKLATRRHWRIEQMVQRMVDETRRLDELAMGGIGVRTTLAASYRGLTNRSRQLFIRLSLLGNTDFGSWVSAPLLDDDLDSASDALDELIEANLVEVRVDEDSSSRFRLHDLVRIYALELLAAHEPAADRADALRRLLSCWLSLAVDAHRRAYGGDYGLHSEADVWMLPIEVRDLLLDSPLTWFRRQRAGLILAVTQSAQLGLEDVCWDLAVTMVTLFESDYLVDDWQKTHELALEAVRKAGNLRGEAVLLWSLGNLALTCHPSKASRYLESALHIFERLSDIHGRALALAALAFGDRLTGRYDQGLNRYRQVLADCRTVGEKVGEVDALGNLAQIALDRENYDAARQLLDEARASCRELQAPRVVAQTEHRIAELYLRTGEWSRAEESFSATLESVSERGDLVGKAYALAGLGAVRARQGRYRLAEADLSAALDLSRNMPSNLVHGKVLLTLAELNLAHSDPDRASALVNEGLGIFGETGPAPVLRARFLEIKARVDEQAGNPAAADDARRQALELVGDSDTALSRSLTAAIIIPASGAISPLPRRLAPGRPGQGFPVHVSPRAIVGQFLAVRVFGQPHA